jgi:hypothetical protein
MALTTSTSCGPWASPERVAGRDALRFGAFVGLMPVVGPVLGHSLADELGSTVTPSAGAFARARWCVGRRDRSLRRPKSHQEPGTGYERSCSNRCGAECRQPCHRGFALGAYRVTVLTAASIVAGGSVLHSPSLASRSVRGSVADWLGRGLARSRIGQSEFVARGVLVLVGAAIGTGLL